MAVIRELAGPPSLTTGLLCVFLIGFTNYITFQSTTGPTTTSQPPRTLSDLAPPCCRLAFEHSYGLIDDIPDATWREHYQQPSLNPRRYGDARGPNDVNSHIPTYYIFEQLDPWFSCPGRHRLGGLGDGPKFTCNPHRVKELMEQRDTLAGSQPKAPRLGLASALTLGRSKSDKPYDCLVYSFLGGKRDNYRWEESLAELLDGRCEIHIFDFELTHGKSEWTNNALYRNVVFHPWRLHSSQGSSSYFEGTGGVSTADHTALSFRDVQHRLGHEGRTIDLFKMDCIGCEWDTFQDWMTADIRQLIVKTYGLIPKPTLFFEGLRGQGFELYAKDMDCSDGGRGNMTDWSWIKLSPDFRLNVTLQHS